MIRRNVRLDRFRQGADVPEVASAVPFSKSPTIWPLDWLQA